MRLIIVSGPEATGKTEVGKEVARRLDCKYKSKDMIKEKLFNTENHNTWDYGWYEKKAKKDFFKDISSLVKNDSDAVIESNFIGKDKTQLSNSLNTEVMLTELYCETKGLTSFKRFIHRNESGKRHKGHHDRRWYFKVLAEDLLRYLRIRWPHKPSGLTKKLLIIDTTDFQKVNYEEITAFIKQV